MAIDWTKYEGYRDDMTPEEKLALLESATPTDPAPTETAPEDPAPTQRKVEPKAGTISKVQYDKLASDYAALKKRERARMSEEEVRAEEVRLAQEAMQNELETLRREKTVSTHKAMFLAQGYAEAEADKMAVALTDGDTDELFAGMKRHGVAAEKALRDKILKDTPVPPAGTDPNKLEQAKEKAELNNIRAAAGLPPI